MPFEWYQYIDKGTTLVIKSQSVCNAIALSHTELWFIALHCDSYVYQAFFPRASTIIVAEIATRWITLECG